MRAKPKCEAPTLHPFRLISLVLAVFLCYENLSYQYLVKITHSHAHDPSVAHAHPEISGVLTEYLPLRDPASKDTREHSHVVSIVHETHSTESKSTRLIFPPIATRTRYGCTFMLGFQMYYGDPLFKPPRSEDGQFVVTV